MRDQPSDGIQLLDAALIADVVAAARRSPRKRMNFNFHHHAADNPHRFLNVLLAGTYVTPHRHRQPPKAESFLVLAGRIVCFVFEDDGALRESFTLAADGDDNDGQGIDLQPGIWHSIAALSGVAVCYEVKPGPYDPHADKEFAPWAPVEGDPECDAYLQGLLAQHSGGAR